MSAKILVVEDEADMQKLIALNLTEAGYDVITALDGEEALTKVKDGNPDLVLLDVVLSGIDGFEVCRQIKSEINPEIKVIIYTGKIEAIDAAKARRLGADDFVVKTYDLEFIIKSVKKLLGV